MYRIKITPLARRELKKISKLYQEPIDIAFSELKEDPYIGKPLDRELTGRFPYKVGVYRVLYRINIKDKIVLLRVLGVIKSGKVTDINFRKIVSLSKEAHIVLKNTHKLSSKETEINETANYTSVKDIEENVIKNNLGKFKFKSDENENEIHFIQEIVKNLDKEKDEGEKNTDFEKRIIKDIEKILEL